MKYIKTLIGILVGVMFVSVDTIAFDDKKIYESQKRLSVGFELGTSEGDANVDRYGGVLRYNFEQVFQTGSGIQGRFYAELSATYWDGENGTTGNNDLFDFGMTPVFRLSKKGRNLSPFIELGLGPHVHTKSKIENEDFDIPFAFGSHFGLGLELGGDGNFELLYRFQHLSNASLGDENPGINFHALQLVTHF
ncbi:MAG: hypothetical protein CBC29_04250 [Methylococcaceae bacterium TMED69]|nr:MAG: hypothetical protein CBC29_04250 [Methylococcaceae bacterium TMED69]|tara:strand:+ start:1070 stop:1648 length:579 start_codon:yes stop_codon:yes gene_type:complete